MAKFTLNCEFDTAEELREFLVAGGVDIVAAVQPAEPVVTQVVESTEELATDTEETKKRKRRTKAEIEAARVAALEEEARPVTKVEEVVVIPPSAVEVMPPIGVAAAQPAMPNFNVQPMQVATPHAPVNLGIPNFAPTNVPTIMVAAPTAEVQQVVQPQANGLPADLLGALGGISM